MNAAGAFERGKRADRFTLLALSQPQFVQALEVKPKLGARAKEMGQPQGRIPRDRPSAVQNPGDAVRRHVQLAGQLEQRSCQVA